LAVPSKFLQPNAFGPVRNGLWAHRIVLRHLRVLNFEFFPPLIIFSLILVVVVVVRATLPNLNNVVACFRYLCLSIITAGNRQTERTRALPAATTTTSRLFKIAVENVLPSFSFAKISRAAAARESCMFVPTQITVYRQWVILRIGLSALSFLWNKIMHHFYLSYLRPRFEFCQIMIACIFCVPSLSCTKLSPEIKHTWLKGDAARVASWHHLVGVVRFVWVVMVVHRIIRTVVVGVSHLHKNRSRTYLQDLLLLNIPLTRESVKSLVWKATINSAEAWVEMRKNLDVLDIPPDTPHQEGRPEGM
jgi:hypothetical protein